MELIERLDLAEWERDHVVGGAYRVTIDTIPQLLREIGRAQAAEARLIGERDRSKEEATLLKGEVANLQHMVRVSEYGYRNACEVVHYPECWDTAAYPTLTHALREIGFECSCDECQTTSKEIS